MESKLNYSTIETYAKNYSAKFSDTLFNSDSLIDGDRILKFPVKQVGLFVLSNIYNSWSLETEKLRSPYFNYEAAAVKSGIQKLMNVLSNNIAIDRANLEPLLSEAVYKTLLLILSPYSYFKDLLIDKNIDRAEFTNLVKFIAINKSVADTIIAKMQTSEVESLDRRALLDEVFLEVEGPEEPKRHINIFAELLPINLDAFYLSMNISPEDDEEEEEQHQSDNITLNDQFASNTGHRTLADQLKQNQGNAGSIKSMLSINQKFMFINDLFKDNQEDFNKVVDFLETCESKEVAQAFINNNYLKRNIWNANAPQVKQFIALIDKKFS